MMEMLMIMYNWLGFHEICWGWLSLDVVKMLTAPKHIPPNGRVLSICDKFSREAMYVIAWLHVHYNELECDF